MDLSGYVFDDKVIVLYFSKPSHYLSIDLSGGLPVCEVSMVGEYSNWNFRSCNMWSEVF